jgi:flagellar biogenesis protein FliO
MAESASTVELLIRLVFSLGVILGIMAIAAKLARRNGKSLRAFGLGRKDEAAVQVIERHSLSKAASVALVQMGERRMLVGVTDHGISLLADAEADTEDTEEETADQYVDAFPAEIAAPATVAPLSASPAAFSAARATVLRSVGGGGNQSTETGRTPFQRSRSVAPDAADPSGRPPRMSFIEALREMTVRKA